MAKMTDITFTAAVYKVQTLADGGIRLTLDLPETAVMQAAQLMECKRFGVVLGVKCEPRETDNDNERDTGKAAKIHI